MTQDPRLLKRELDDWDGDDASWIESLDRSALENLLFSSATADAVDAATIHAIAHSADHWSWALVHGDLVPNDLLARWIHRLVLQILHPSRLTAKLLYWVEEELMPLAPDYGRGELENAVQAVDPGYAVGLWPNDREDFPPKSLRTGTGSA